MKILQVIPYFVPAFAFGGPPAVAHQISSELVRRGHDVVIYTSNTMSWNSRMAVRPVEFLDGIEVHYFRIVPPKLFLKMCITPKLVNEARRNVSKFDIIHLHEFRTFQNAVICHYARKHSVPQVLHPHGSIPLRLSHVFAKNIYDRLVGKQLLRNVTKVIALNKTEASQLRHQSVPSQLIEIVPNGIDPALRNTGPPKGTFRNKYSLRSEEKLLLCLGRIHRFKGIDILIQAFALLTKTHSNIKLVIVGPDEGYLTILRALAKDLNISDSVLFTGPLYGKDKLSAYVDADIFVLPSLYEAFPMVLLEASAFSVPIIVSRIESVVDILEDGTDAIMFKPGDHTDLAKGLELMLTDNTLANRVGRNALKRVRERYSITRIAQEIERIYAECLRSADA